MLLTGLMSSRRRHRSRGLRRDAQVSTAPHAGPSFREIERLESRRLLTVPDAALFPLDATGFGQVSGDIVDGTQPELFRFEPVIGGRYVVEQNSNGSGLDSFLRVLDENCDFVTLDDDSGPGRDSRLELFVNAGDVFFLEAGSFGSSTGSFTLTATRDDFDNSLSTNGAIILDQEGNGSIFGEIERTGDRDLFAITSPLTGTLTIQQNSAPGSSLDPVLSVFDDNGQLIAQNDDSGFADGDFTLNSRVDIPVVANQTLLVRAAGFFNSTGDYDLLFSASDPIADDFGNTFADATPLTLDATGSVQQSGVIELASDVDVFSVVVPPDVGTLTVRQVSPDGQLDSFLRAFDSLESLVAENDDSGFSLDSQVAISTTPGETVFFQAGSFPGSFGSYNLLIESGGQFTDAVGNTDATAQPFVLNSANQFVTSSELEVAGDQDVYTTTIDAAGIVTVQLNAIGSGGFLDTLLRVRNSVGTQITFDDDGGEGLNSRTDVIVSAGDELFFGVGAFADASAGEYLLDITFQPGAGDDFPVNSVAQPEAGDLVALNIPLAGTLTQSGSIDVALDADVFLVNVPELGAVGETVNVLIRQTAAAGPNSFGFSGLDSFLRVFDSAGNLIAQNDDTFFSLDSEVVVSVPNGSSIFVQAGAFGSSTGRYDLTFDLITDDFVDVPAGAETLAFDTPVGGTIERAGDVDVFQIGVPSRPDDADPVNDVRVRVSQTATDGTFDGFLTVFRQLDDGSLQFVAQNDDSNGTLNSQVDFEFKVNATYVVFARAFGSVTGDYELAVTELPADGDDFGDSFEGAESIQFQTTDSANFSGVINPAGDLDVFTFTSDRNGSATVELDPEDGLGGRVSVFRINTQAGTGSVEREPVRIARSIASSDQFTADALLSSTASFPLASNNQYFVVVDRVSGSETGAYTVDLQLSDTPFRNPNGVVPPDVLASVTALAREQFAAGIDFNIMLDAAAQELQQKFGDLGDNEFFIFISDPVDFILADSENRQVGFTADQGRVNEVGGAQLSQNAPIEVLILPTTGRQFPVQLQGVGSNFQIGGRIVTQAGILNGNLTTATGAATAGSGTLSKNDGNVALVFDFTLNTIPRIEDPVTTAERVLITATDATAFQFRPGDQIAIAEEAVRAAQDLRDTDDGRPPTPGPNLLQSLIDYLQNSDDEELRKLGGSLEFLIDSIDGEDSDDDTGASGSDVFWSVFGGGVMNHLWELGDQIIEHASDSDSESEADAPPDADQTQPESSQTPAPEGDKSAREDEPSEAARPAAEAAAQPSSDGTGQEPEAATQPRDQSSPQSAE